MPYNPDRSSQGGDVSGFTNIDVTQGKATQVATASFDPGYDLDTTLQDAHAADLVQGFTSYGRAIGEGGRRMSAPRSQGYGKESV